METAIGVLVIQYGSPVIRRILFEPTGGASRQVEEIVVTLHGDVKTIGILESLFDLSSFKVAYAFCVVQMTLKN
jgi:hypothetical protein